MNEELDENKPRKKFAVNSAKALLKQAKITFYPIRVNSIIKLIPNLHIDGVPLEDELSGMQAQSGEQVFIRYNANHPKVRNRFTVSHEVGHAVLAHTSSCKLGNFMSKDIIEVEANQFAAELLMPMAMLKQAVIQYPSTKELAALFWVSEEAMGWRVMDTGIYKRLSSWK
jgi:Zn-dependent peptidase ImmA (M78 family)